MWRLFLLGLPVLASAADPKLVEFFEMKVRPVLVKHCHACHTDSQIARLRVDSREHLLHGGRSGPAIVPGDPANSLIVQAVTGMHARLKMPPAGKLTAQEIDDLKQWIAEGAAWPKAAAAAGPESAAAAAPSGGEYRIKPEQRAHWAYQPVRMPALPAVSRESWVRTPVDRFILARLDREKLAAAGPASKHVLIRRASFDLTGLPPAPEDVEAFLADKSPKAFERVVDRLLASPRYGERWGRHWLDLARYSDGQLGAANDDVFLNAHRYRDWVIEALNEDLPYDKFLKAQLAADFLPEPERSKMLPALGFHALGPGGDDRVDVTARVMLGLTVGCAQCHDHKFDPIPARDYYSMLGVFRSSEKHEFPLAPEAEVTRFRDHKKRMDLLNTEINEFTVRQSVLISEILATATEKYLTVAYPLMLAAKPDAAEAAKAAGLDEEVLGRWVKYLASDIEHPHLEGFLKLIRRGKAGEVVPTDDVAAEARRVRDFVVKMFEEKHAMDDRNYVALGGTEGSRIEAKRQYTNLESLDILRYYFWRDLASDPYRRDFVDFKGGVYYFGAKDIARWLSPLVATHLAGMRERHEALKKSLPAQYPFLHSYRDKAKPANIKVELRGNPETLGEEAPRRFLQILAPAEPTPFTRGSGRMELAEAITDPRNPLTARVMVNRVWHHHFGAGLVRTTSNFGQLGERPANPELLDYLASRFVAGGWSLKKLHREIMLSAVYQLSSSAEGLDENVRRDPANQLLWRAPFRSRLDIEALRDALLAVGGDLDDGMGGKAEEITESNRRRTVYGYVGRTKLNPTLALFDFPNPNSMADERMTTIGPMQRLYFMNSPFVAGQARKLAARVEREAGADSSRRIDRAYRLLYSRPPDQQERAAGLEFLAAPGATWPQYAQVLLAASEFSSVQ
ncbi:MAG: DUF1553 domain-containing protein [Acidobacteria bacterium]|nr:DUF1553 domain-containing protein [Acidobacteriota bacterium]